MIRLTNPPESSPASGLTDGGVGHCNIENCGCFCAKSAQKEWNNMFVRGSHPHMSGSNSFKSHSGQHEEKNHQSPFRSAYSAFEGQHASTKLNQSVQKFKIPRLSLLHHTRTSVSCCNYPIRGSDGSCSDDIIMNVRGRCGVEPQRHVAHR